MTNVNDDRPATLRDLESAHTETDRRFAELKLELAAKSDLAEIRREMVTTTDLRIELQQMTRALDESIRDQLRAFLDVTRSTDDRLDAHLADPTAHAAK